MSHGATLATRLRGLRTVSSCEELLISLEKKMFGSCIFTAYSSRVKREPIGTPPPPAYVVCTALDEPMLLG